MAKSNKYGYSGVNIPTQGFRDNKGKFDPAEINELVADNKWTQYGQLELIETQSITSSTASMIFSSIQESTYNVHFLTYSNFEPVTSDDRLGLRFFESGVEESGTVYQFANQLCRADGTFTEPKSTSSNHIRLGTNVSTTANNTDSGYMYLYNLGNIAKYSYVTVHTVGLYYNGSHLQTEYGGGVLPQASIVNQIKLLCGNNPSNNIANLQASLYGIKEY